MKVSCIGHSFDYEAGNVARLFFDDVTVAFSDDGDLLTYASEQNGMWVCRVVYKDTEKTVSESSDSETGERVLGKAIFETLCEATGKRPPWGILTGVRPIRITERKGENAADFLVRQSLVSEEKATLAVKTAKNESKILSLSRPESFSLYIGIPFCPSRCLYCSFVSKTVENAGKLIDEYAEKLVKDIAFTAETARRCALRLESVYFGGGTPTVLSSGQLDRIMKAVSGHFDLSHLREYTVEGGRPETITEDKLDTLIVNGCDRLSINPQTMHDSVLSACGRNHTVDDVYRAYEMARNFPFHTVNMDLIAGLVSDTAEGFCYSLDSVLALKPENVTVHTLCIKRAAYLNEERPPLPSDEDVVKMLSYSQKMLDKSGYIPYYLYRQRNTLANGENVGWAKPGHESYYNVYIMDQTHTILSCGAGGVNILRQPNGDHIERVFHYKYPYEYISRFDTLMERKQQIAAFYERYQ